MYNDRELIDKIKFQQWTPTTTNISNIDEIRGYWQTIGGMVYYFIRITGSAPDLAIGAGVTATITNPPYGGISLSGGKSTYESFPLEVVANNANDIRATLAYSSGVPIINISDFAGAAIAASVIRIYGWFIRD
jgi:hypothetical protein